MFTLSLLLITAVAATAQSFGMTEGLGAAVANSRQLAAGAPQAIAAFRAAAFAPTEAAVQPINAGFTELGDAGQTGKIKGPGLFGMGDGTYQVVQNDPYQMVFDMKTGFVVGRFTLTRDPETGKDSLGFTGQKRDMSHPWKSSTGTFPGKVAYNAATDSGTIAWQLDGVQENDTFKGNGDGATITITGYTHVFTQN